MGPTNTQQRHHLWLNVGTDVGAGLTVNEDGSVDVYFGPAAPDGASANWVLTKAGNGFEVIFLFYGPDKPLFDRTWKLPDIEKVHS